ncbi:MAG: right-handed parallel beta-helix repeat-containing protein [Bacteroidota bacterium]|nr:right-handed parallel beta-helix repeat-containing protein [Bacteroidota bacterium]
MINSIWPWLAITLLVSPGSGRHLSPHLGAPLHYRLTPDRALSHSTVVHISDFGAIPDGKTNSTTAFQKASRFLEAHGGTLIIDPGVYLVGRQHLSGSYTSGSSYIPEPIIRITGAQRPIIILGDHAELKAADGLKFGSFNPVTGLKDSIRKIGNRSDYYAAAFTFIAVIKSASITIKGLTLNGNSPQLDIGPAFGPEGIQMPALGISLNQDRKALIEDCYIHHCALDGVLIAWTGLTTQDPPYPHTLRHVQCEYNGRQGLSWVGGNQLTVTDCDFSSTGKALNHGVLVSSKPGAGIDIENEGSILRNARFVDCRIFDNTGPGVVSIGENTRNIQFQHCTFIGTTHSAAYPKSPGFSFDHCTFVGRVERIFGSADSAEATRFTHCFFTLDPKYSPNGQVFGDTWEFYEGAHVVFDHCQFDAADQKLPTFNTPEVTFVDCSFSQSSNADFQAAAIFRDTTWFHLTGKARVLTSLSRFTGPVILNGKPVTRLSELNFRK